LIYDNIKEIADKRNISICKLERDSGLSNGTIVKWQNASPRLENLMAVAKALNVPITKLIK